MKSILLRSFVLLTLGMAAASAQPYAITGQVVAGGGGVASGGRFQVAGTVGQPAVGARLIGGCLSIDPGFWGASAVVSEPGAPTLHVRRLDSNYVRVSFAPGCGQWVLQWTRALAAEPRATVWTDDVADNLIPVGEELVRDFHVPSRGSFLAFRLRQP